MFVGLSYWQCPLTYRKIFSFRSSHLLIFDLRAWAICVPFRKISPVPMCSRFFPIFSSIRLSASGFMWRSLIQLDLSFVQRDKIGSIWILLHLDCQLEFVENFVFFPLCDLTLCQRSSDHRYVGLFLGLQFYSIGLPVCNSLLLCSIEWGQGWGFPQKFWQQIENFFCYPLFIYLFICIPDEVENCSFHLCEELCLNFDGYCNESLDCF